MYHTWLYQLRQDIEVDISHQYKSVRMRNDLMRYNKGYGIQNNA